MASVRKKAVSTVQQPRVAGGSGAIASQITPIQQLTRLTMANMLWENAAYEDGVSIAQKIAEVIPQCEPVDVAGLAMRARTEMKLRHVPLLLARELARHPRRSEQPRLVSSTLESIIQRPDEIAEFMAIYQKDGKQPIAKQVKVGLGAAFNKFNEYSLAKYSSEGKDISIRDVLFLVHAKPDDITHSFKWDAEARRIHGNAPRDPELSPKETLFKKIVKGTLQTPDTWEVSLSGGADKAETFTRLMKEGKLGSSAFLRNLRNMIQSGVSHNEIIPYGLQVKCDRELPFRFIAAKRNSSTLLHPMLETMMLKSLAGSKKLPGRTVLIVDISGSMGVKISGKSDMSRYDAAYALAILMREVCEDIVIYATAGCDGRRIHATKAIGSEHRGWAVEEELIRMNSSLGGGGIFLKQCMDYVYEQEGDITPDRIVVLTDEQDTDIKCNPENAVAFGKRNYIMNVSSNTNGVAYKKWTHISGWSESVIDYMIESEEMEAQFA